MLSKNVPENPSCSLQASRQPRIESQLDWLARLSHRHSLPRWDAGLILARLFSFNGNVLADDDVTSLTALGPATAGQHGGVAFTMTHWRVGLEAQGDSPAAQEALEKPSRTYSRTGNRF